MPQGDQVIHGGHGGCGTAAHHLVVVKVRRIPVDAHQMMIVIFQRRDQLRRTFSKKNQSVRVRSTAGKGRGSVHHGGDVRHGQKPAQQTALLQELLLQRVIKLAEEQILVKRRKTGEKNIKTIGMFFGRGLLIAALLQRPCRRVGKISKLLRRLPDAFLQLGVGTFIIFII